MSGAAGLLKKFDAAQALHGQSPVLSGPPRAIAVFGRECAPGVCRPSGFVAMGLGQRPTLLILEQLVTTAETAQRVRHPFNVGVRTHRFGVKTPHRLCIRPRHRL
jgi:hypothetical protein